MIFLWLWLYTFCVSSWLLVIRLHCKWGLKFLSILIETLLDKSLESFGAIFYIMFQINILILLKESMQLWNCLFKFFWAPKLFNDYCDIILIILHAISWSISVCAVPLTLQALKDDLNPSMNVVILLIRILDYSVWFPNAFSFLFDKFINNSFDDSYTHFVILSFIVMVYNN